jgi:twitching motility protein PilT
MENHNSISQDISSPLSELIAFLKLQNDIYIFLQDPHLSRCIPDVEFDREFSTILAAELNKIQFENESEVVEIYGFLWRLTLIPALHNNIVAMRKILSKPADSLEHLKYPSIYDELLGHHKLSKGGLVLFAGASGAGKTTAATAAVRLRLMKFGGMCLTVEDPPEVLLDGTHGKGFCIQRKVKHGRLAEAVRDSLRSFPSKSGQIFFIGEIRDPETAYHAITSGVNGQLVLATIHSATPISACQRIVSMAEEYSSDATDMFAGGLKAVFHLREFNGNRLPTVFVNNTSTGQMIRDNKVPDIKSVIERQMTIFQGKALPHEDISQW